MKFKFLLTIFLFNYYIYGNTCTPINRLTMEETIEKSELIILATVVDFIKPKIDERETSIFFEIDEILFGQTNDGYIKISGRIVNKSLGNKHLIPYERGRRRTSEGQCIATDYEYGSTYLLMIKDKTPYWSAYNPVNEKINGANDPWLLWVKGFLAGIQYNKNNK